MGFMEHMDSLPAYDIVFVVLVYRNTGDLEAFYDNLAKVPGSCRVVVVNSYYDEASRADFERICKAHGSDFVNADNRGYGTGNNRGIDFARVHYRFHCLIVCNPDVVIERMPPDLSVRMRGACVYGPMIRTLTGKRQNPCMVLYSPLRELLLRFYAVHPKVWPVFYTAIAINKLERIVFNMLFGGRVRHVYSLHGSFLIFSGEALARLGQPFDPNMFMFREEDYLARLARQKGVGMVYYPLVRVLHKEDGSVKFMEGGVRRYTVDSLRVYFGLPR